MKFQRILIILIFGGSVFLTSSKFVDAQNAPKYYFVVIFLLILGLFNAFILQIFSGYSVLRNNEVFSGIFAICLLQALIWLAQYVGLLNFNYSRFAVTGSFDNPAGFAAVLSIGFPAGVFLFTKSERIEKYYTAVIFR